MTNNKQTNNAIVLNNDSLNEDLFCQVRFYPLIESDFELMVLNRSDLNDWADKVISATIGLVLNLMFIIILTSLHYHGYLLNFAYGRKCSSLDIGVIILSLLIYVILRYFAKKHLGPSEKIKAKIRNYFNRNNNE